MDAAIRMHTEGSFYKNDSLNYVELAGKKAGVLGEEATYRMYKVLGMCGMTSLKNYSLVRLKFRMPSEE